MNSAEEPNDGIRRGDEGQLRITARLPVPAAGAAFTQPSARHGACLRTPRARPQVRQPPIR